MSESKLAKLVRCIRKVHVNNAEIDSNPLSPKLKSAKSSTRTQRIIFAEKKDSVDNTTWPKKRSGGAHKRKGDVFKSIGKQDPNFTVRRMEVHMMEELEKIQAVKKVEGAGHTRRGGAHTKGRGTYMYVLIT